MAGKNFVGRLGAELDCASVTDILKILDDDTFIRPMYAGNALATVRTSSPVKVLTVRPTAFEKAPTTGGSASIDPLPSPTGSADAGLASFVSESMSGGDRPELTVAKVVVSGGRGMKEGENFKILGRLADTLGGAVGASRAAVDAGFVPNELQASCSSRSHSSSSDTHYPLKFFWTVGQRNEFDIHDQSISTYTYIRHAIVKTSVSDLECGGLVGIDMRLCLALARLPRRPDLISTRKMPSF